MYSSMKITDEFYSNLSDGEIQKRIGGLSSKKEQEEELDRNELEFFKEYLDGNTINPH